MAAMSASVPANDRASASGRPVPASPRSTSTAPRMAMLETAAWRSAATSARLELPSSADSFSQVRICLLPSRKVRAKAGVLSALPLSRSAASLSRRASRSQVRRRGEGASSRPATMAAAAGMATSSHAYSSMRVLASPIGTRPIWSSPKPTIIARMAPMGRSLLAEARNRKPADSSAMAETRRMG